MKTWFTAGKCKGMSPATGKEHSQDIFGTVFDLVMLRKLSLWSET